MLPEQDSSIHRFGDHIALSFETVPHTIYLDVRHAEWLRHKLCTAIRDVHTHKFSASPFNMQVYTVGDRPKETPPPSPRPMQVALADPNCSAAELWDVICHAVQNKEKPNT